MTATLEASPRALRPTPPAFPRIRNPARLWTPDKPGQYELRYAASRPDAILATRPLTLLPVTTSVTCAETVGAGSELLVTWSGPNSEYDKLTIVPAGAADNQKGRIAYTSSGNPVRLLVPDQAGAYEVRYLSTYSGAVLATAKLTVTGVNASVSGPATTIGGATIAVSWTGPNSEYDKIAVVRAGEKEKRHGGSFAWSAYTSDGNPARVHVPEEPGDYELRYVSMQGATFAAAKLSVTAATAAIEGPVTAVAGTTFQVAWEGPGNEYDQIAIGPADSASVRWVASRYIE